MLLGLKVMVATNDHFNPPTNKGRFTESKQAFNQLMLMGDSLQMLYSMKKQGQFLMNKAAIVKQALSNPICRMVQNRLLSLINHSVIFLNLPQVVVRRDSFIALKLQRRKKPVWVFHGDADKVVPLEESERMVKALRRRGGKPKFTIYKGVNHDSWTETYNNPKLYEWFLSHKKE